MTSRRSRWPGAFAALVIHEVADVLDLTAVPHRRAQDTMRPHQIGDEKAAGPAQGECRLLEQSFPVHGPSIRSVQGASRARSPAEARAPLALDVSGASSALVEPQSIELTAVLLEPVGQSFVVRRLAPASGVTPKTSAHTSALSNAPCR